MFQIVTVKKKENGFVAKFIIYHIINLCYVKIMLNLYFKFLILYDIKCTQVI